MLGLGDHFEWNFGPNRPPRSAHHIKRKLLFEDQPNGYAKDLVAKHTAGNPRWNNPKPTNPTTGAIPRGLKNLQIKPISW